MWASMYLLQLIPFLYSCLAVSSSEDYYSSDFYMDSSELAMDVVYTSITQATMLTPIITSMVERTANINSMDSVTIDVSSSMDFVSIDASSMFSTPVFSPSISSIGGSIFFSSEIITSTAAIDTTSTTISMATTLDTSSIIVTATSSMTSPVTRNPDTSTSTTSTTIITTSTPTTTISSPTTLSTRLNITSTTFSTVDSGTTSTTSVTGTTAPSPSQIPTVIGIVVAACAIILLLICGSGIVILVWVRKSKRSKSYSLQTDLTIENNNSERTILLRSLSTSGKENNKHKIKEGVFDHIPIILPISINDLPRYVHDLENIEDAASDEFESLIPHSRSAPCDVSQQNSNIPKNRYTNILPFDDTRVVLGSKASFINANYITGYNNADEYIATQGPLPHTISDFWQMVFESGCNTIVMVTNPVEAGNLKCEVYWPEENEAMQCNNISVNNIKETVRPSCTIREFVLSIPEKKTKASSSRLVTSRECKQFHFTTWPDMGVPMDIATMLRFVKKVRANVTSTANPIVIHCSAGVGRTGTFIAIDVQLQRMQATGDINVKEMVLQLRAQRASMVQTLPQYLFIYNCLLHEHLYGETEVTSSSIKDHFDHLLDIFPGTEDSRLEKEFEGANSIIHPDSTLLEAATDPDNISKNREGAGIPLDLNRVHLNDPFSSGCDYINASYIGVFGRKAEFVMTQHPLKSTTEDFWRMMIERNFSTIVVIGNVKEEDMYWPIDGPLRFNELEVRMVESEEEDVVNIISLEIESEETEECVSVQIFQLMQWPRNEVPSNTKGILLLSELVSEHSKGLLVIHSSASIHEQCVGVFCIIHSLRKRLNNGETVDVMGSTRRALQQRQGCIISTEQYEFIYEALADSVSSSSSSE